MRIFILLFFLSVTAYGQRHRVGATTSRNQISPITQAHDITLTAATTTSLTISWTSGNGQNRIVVAKAGKLVDSPPVDGTTYTASATFGSGTQIGTGNYVVYNSTGTSVTVTGLTANTEYTFRVYEYNTASGDELYLKTVAYLNPFSEYTFTTEYAAVLSHAVSISATAPTFTDQVFDNQMARRLVRETILSTLDIFYYFANSQQNFSQINWANPGTFNAKLINSPTFTANQGFNGNGTTSYIKTGYAPSAGTNFTLDSNGGGVLITSANQQHDGFDMGSVSTGPVRYSLRARSTANLILMNNNTSANNTAANTTSNALHHTMRTGSNPIFEFSDLERLINTNQASVSLPTATLYIGARHNTAGTDTVDLWSTNRYGMAFMGASLNAKYIRFWGAVYARYIKFKPVFPTVVKTGITEMEGFGDSFMVGQAAAANNGFIDLLQGFEFAGSTLTNNGVSGRGAYSACDAACQKVVGDTGNSIWIEMVGLNDVRRGGSQAQTMNKVEAWLRVMMVNHFASSFVAGGSSGVTRGGAYNTGYNARTVAGRFTTGSLPGDFATQNAAGAAGTVSYTFTGTDAGVQLISGSSSGSFGTCTISLDGVVQRTVDLRTWWDNISDGSNANSTGPVAFWFTGLTNASHTILITANGDGICPVDFFAPLTAAASCQPLLISDIPLVGANNYVAGGLNLGSLAAANFMSTMKFKIAKEIRDAGYPVVYFNVNNYYQPVSPYIDADNVHPSGSGHRKIAAGMVHLFDGN